MATGELARELMLQLIKVRMAFRQIVQRELKRNNIEMTFEMLQVMYRLWTEQGVTQQCLAEKTAKDKACLSNLVNNLEKKGWVTRRQDPADRRNRLVYLTAEGEALSNRIIPLVREVYDRAGAKMNTRQAKNCLDQLTRWNEIFDQI